MPEARRVHELTLPSDPRQLREVRRFGARDENQLSMRTSAKMQDHMRERFEFALEAIPRRLRALRDSTQLAHIAREQRDDSIRIGVVARAEHYRGRGFFGRHLFQSPTLLRNSAC